MRFGDVRRARLRAAGSRFATSIPSRHSHRGSHAEVPSTRPNTHRWIRHVTCRGRLRNSGFKDPLKGGGKAGCGVWPGKQAAAGEVDGRGQPWGWVKEPERAGERGAMGAGARRMYGWAVEDAPVRAPDGQGVGGCRRERGSDLPVLGRGLMTGAELAQTKSGATGRGRADRTVQEEASFARYERPGERESRLDRILAELGEHRGHRPAHRGRRPHPISGCLHRQNPHPTLPFRPRRTFGFPIPKC